MRRTGTNPALDEEQAEQALRRLLAEYGEPTTHNPPPNLVIRTARQIPARTPAQLATHRRLMITAGLLIGVLILAIAVFGAWIVLTGAQLPALLAIQLILKPIIGTIETNGFGLVVVGVGALLGSSLLINQTYALAMRRAEA